jgi:hypothetical protein
VCEKASHLGWCQAGEGEPNADEVNQGLLRAGSAFVVFTQALGRSRVGEPQGRISPATDTGEYLPSYEGLSDESNRMCSPRWGATSMRVASWLETAI